MKKSAKKHAKKSVNKTLIYAKHVVSQTKSNSTKIITIVIALISIAIIVNAFREKQDQIKTEKQQQESEEAIKELLQEKFESGTISEIKALQDKTDISKWKEYAANWYGFKIKYPESWKKPAPRASAKGSAAEYEYEFRKPASNTDIYAGFDVVIYNTSKIDALSKTDEFPKKKSDAPQCETITGRLIETGDYSAEQIYVPAEDECYDPTMFFSVTQGQYTYNIVPVLKDDKEFTGDPLKEISDNMPEFFAIISTFENIDITRPKPKASAPTASFRAPMPAAFKRDSAGRLVCNKKNDKPGKSKQHKSKHLDMECCLDPDEYPNPNCYYDPGKYGKYL